MKGAIRVGKCFANEIEGVNYPPAREGTGHAITCVSIAMGTGVGGARGALSIQSLPEPKCLFIVQAWAKM